MAFTLKIGAILMNKNIRFFNKRPYYLANSFKRDHNGKPISKAKSKSYAENYAQAVRKKGYNARVINWAGGSGVYVGRRYNYESIEKARKAWLNEAEEERYESATSSNPFDGLGMTVPTLSVGGNPNLALGARQKQGRSRYEMMWDGKSLATDQEKVLDSILTNEFSGGEEVASLDASIDENMTDEIKDEFVFYKALQASEEIEPVIVNQIPGDNNSGFAMQYTTPKRTGRQASTMGWGIEGRIGPKRFDVSTKRTRHHVVASWKLEDGGWDEAPLMAFADRRGAERFLDELSHVAYMRGELVLTSDQKGVQTVVPEKNIELAIVKEYGEDFANKAINRETDVNNVMANLNVERNSDGKLRSSLPGPDEFKTTDGVNKFFEGWRF